VSIGISPTLTEAEVVWQRPFLADWHNGEEVMLQQTAVYRQGEQRWLQAAFDDSFWGTWETTEGQHFILTYPSRDEALALRLLTDLEALVETVCATCLQNQYRIRFSTNSQHLAELPQAFSEKNGSSFLNLPTPTLVGLPVDEAGYSALLAGYQVHIAAMLINSQAMQARCCGQGNLFHYALLVRQLVELGFLPPALVSVDYATDFQQSVAGLIGLGDFWTDWWEPADSMLFPEEDRRFRQIQAILSYLEAIDPDISWLEQHQRLYEAADYRRWLQKYVPVGSGFGGNREQERKWLRFVEAQFPTAVSPLPAQDIQLLCSEGNGRRANLLRYDFARSEWDVELTERTLLFMAPLPDDSGVFLQERQPRLDRTQGVLWQAGQERPALQQPLQAGLFRVDPLDDDFMLYAFNFSDRETSFNFVDLDQCDEAGCPSQTYASLPAWSPDEQYLIYQQGDGFLYLRHLASGVEKFVSTGSLPFWLDNETYGFVLPALNEAGERVEHVLVSNLANEVLLYRPLTLFLTAVPPQALLTSYTIHDIAPNPQNDAELLLALVPQAEEETGAFILAYNRQTRETRRLLTLPYELSPYKPLHFSPDGRWLTVQAFARSDANWELHLYDLVDGQTAVLRSNYVYTLPGYDWSADGNWLLRVDDGFVHLYAPQTGDSRLLVHDQPRCNFAAWVE
ncbi:MAG: hypothetical protein AAF614_31370, partial [Chloroflexota bacterium]